MVNGRATDADLLAAADRAIAEHGLVAVTLEQIAAEAGVSRVTLHRRGLSKERVVQLLVDKGISEYREAVWPALTGAGSALSRLEQALVGLCDTAEERLHLLSGLASVGDSIFHEDDGAERMTRSPFTEPLERLLRDGMADGSIRDLDPIESATLLFNVVGWTYIHLRTGHGWSPDRSSRLTIDIALHGFAAPASSNAGD